MLTQDIADLTAAWHIASFYGDNELDLSPFAFDNNQSLWKTYAIRTAWLALRMPLK